MHRGRCYCYDWGPRSPSAGHIFANLRRSIPCMVDGLNPSERKILFTCFKSNLVNQEIQVTQLQSYLSQEFAHHGEQSLCTTIVGMAWDFVGSNNINLLAPKGLFGTRLEGGKDCACPHYISTCLSPITRFLFPKDDDCLFDCLQEEGRSIESSWYAPIIPTILVNGSEGIGTSIPNYNPRDIVANLRRLLKNEEMKLMHPWYRGFRGKIAPKENGFSYSVNGIIDELNETTVWITELPVGTWTQDYKKWLNSKDFFVLNYGDSMSVCFEVQLSEEQMREAKQEGLLNKFKLTSTISTSNMRLLDSQGSIKRYGSPEEILEEFFHLRLGLYKKRKDLKLSQHKMEADILVNKVRFIQAVINEDIDFYNMERADLVLELHRKEFSPFPKKKSIDYVVVGAEERDEATVNSNGIRSSSDYDYLLYMPMRSFLCEEELEKLLEEQKNINGELEKLRNKSPEDLWLSDLVALEIELDKLDAEEENKRKITENRIGAYEGRKKNPGQQGQRKEGKSRGKEKNYN